MNSFYLLACLFFIVISAAFYFDTYPHFKKMYGKKEWNTWTRRVFYWQGTLAVGSLGTFAVLYFLRTAAVVSF
ncbi:hypothetical protein [Leeuwenhoekiella sp. ZYFB001]|uniref:hypothetical protein n=1 Tax=Leeuwenhoekiella sp. ZYFB001 TaxID=2719912 RepID=UPI00142FE9EA|nr:hypothetical protein [Leeuwenhoekiella sp. ZYFB001]